MKDLFTNKKSLERSKIPSVQELRSLFSNASEPSPVQETAQKPVSRKSFSDSGVKVMMTTDYDSLKLRNDNRPIDFKHVQRLVKSILENGVLMIPGIVNADNEIIDAQHRWAALKQIAETTGRFLPFYFIIEENYGAAEMIRSNALGNIWRKPDYLNHYVKNENPNYILFQKFRDDFEWTNNSTAEIMFTGKIDGANSKREKLLVDNEESKKYINSKKDKRDNCGRTKVFEYGLMEPDDINAAYERAYQLEALGQYYDNFTNTNFVKAVLQLRKIEGFSYQELLNQFEKVFTNKRNDKYQIKDDLKHTIVSYRDCLNDIYNFKKHESSCLNLRSIKR